MEGKLNRINSKTGPRNPCDSRGSEYHLLPHCPHRARVSSGAVPSSPDIRVSPRPPFSAITLGDKVATYWGEAQIGKEDAPRAGPSSISAAPFADFSVPTSDRVVNFRTRGIRRT